MAFLEENRQRKKTGNRRLRRVSGVSKLQACYVLLNMLVKENNSSVQIIDINFQKCSVDYVHLNTKSGWKIESVLNQYSRWHMCYLPDLPLSLSVLLD